MKGFQEAGFKPEVRPLAFFQDDYGLKAEDGQDDVDEEEEDGEGVDGEDGDDESGRSSDGEESDA